MDLDYKKVGFKCGVEIHQQLETHKLFCHCPSIVHDDAPIDIQIERKLRAVAGETGKVDAAASYEREKNKRFLYEGCSTSACLVELDEEPPHEVNKDALDVALQVALLLDATPVDEIRVMRKTVIDGSNVSGFQRTMLIATGGVIKTSKGNVVVDSICLEEESAKKVEEKVDHVRYRLDRLGVPLIEIATDASIKDPDHCKEVASILGMILRSTEKVRRGIGSIRQDVNVSIKGHPRVEIKGFQDLRSIPKVIDFEIKRELADIKAKKKCSSHVRKADKNFTTSFLRPMPGAARMYPETDVPPIAITSSWLKQIKRPELLTERVMKLEKQYKLSPQLAHEVLDNEHFVSYVKQFKLAPELIARTLVEVPKEITKRFGTRTLKQEHFKLVLKALEQKKIDESAIVELLAASAQGKKLDITQFKKVAVGDVEQEITKLVQKNKDVSPNGLMGVIMKKYRGKVDGKKVMQIIQSNLK